MRLAGWARHLPFGSSVVASPTAAIAQLGERQTEDLKVPGSIPGLGSFGDACLHCAAISAVGSAWRLPPHWAEVVAAAARALCGEIS